MSTVNAPPIGLEMYVEEAGRIPFEEWVILLLCAGDKRRQQSDIRRARKYWEDFRKRKKQQGE